MSVAYVYFEDEPDRVWRGCCHATREYALMPEKRKQNDDWNRHSKQPKKNSSRPYSSRKAISCSS